MEHRLVRVVGYSKSDLLAHQRLCLPTKHESASNRWCVVPGRRLSPTRPLAPLDPPLPPVRTDLIVRRMRHRPTAAWTHGCAMLLTGKVLVSRTITRARIMDDCIGLSACGHGQRSRVDLLAAWMECMECAWNERHLVDEVQVVAFASRQDLQSGSLIGRRS